MWRFPMARFLTSREGIAAVALVLSGCGGIGLDSSALGTTGDVPGPVNGGGGGAGGHKSHPVVQPPPDAGSPAYDAGTGQASKFTGSALCKVKGFRCDPDQTACYYDVDETGTGGHSGSCLSGKLECTASPGVAVVPAACRVGTDDEPSCASNFTVSGSEGVACRASSDCAIGYECVGEGTAATCKHYCCESTTCDGLSTGKGPQPFCDIETSIGGQLVPVCAIEPGCTLLASDSCNSSTDMTCTIVNAGTAQTACVTVGNAKAGEDCTTAKCGADLACIGGTCRQLCNTSHDCPSGDTCNYTSGFSSLGTVGLCSNY